MLRINYDNTNEEIEQAYKAFQQKYMLKRNIIYSVVYLIAAGLGVNFAVTNPSFIGGYILMVIGLAMLFSTWAKPYYARKKLMKTLQSFSDEHYTAEFADSYIEIDTIIGDNTETVAITSRGVMTVGEGVEIDEEKEIKQDKTRLDLVNDRLDSRETENLFMLFVNRSLIYIFPKRCLEPEQIKQLAEYLDDKNI